MESASRIPDRIRDDLPAILDCWRGERGLGQDESQQALAAGIESLVLVFVDFLRSEDTVETFSRGGEVRGLVDRIAESQHEVGWDAVGVIDDVVVLRRCIWRSVEASVDLAAIGGGEVARFFVKLLQASDWVTEAGLEAFESTVRREMERELVRAAATDLVTGLPDRDQFNRLLLPRAVASHDRFALVVFDVANFTETVAAGRVSDARKVVSKLAEAVGEAVPEGAYCCRFGDDEICAILPGVDAEGAYGLAERVLERLAADPGDFEVDVGVAEYPTHGTGAGELVGETLKALSMAKRVGGGGIVVGD